LTSERELLAEKYFRCSDSERAAFEAGIKLGTLYHQFVGTPISQENVDLLEKTMIEGTKIQPFVVDSQVVINRDQLRSKKDEFDYDSLSGSMLSVSLTIRYGKAKAVAKMKHIPEIRYPLMYIEKIELDESE